MNCLMTRRPCFADILWLEAPRLADQKYYRKVEEQEMPIIVQAMPHVRNLNQATEYPDTRFI